MSWLSFSKKVPLKIVRNLQKPWFYSKYGILQRNLKFSCDPFAAPENEINNGSSTSNRRGTDRWNLDEESLYEHFFAVRTVEASLIAYI